MRRLLLLLIVLLGQSCTPEVARPAPQPSNAQEQPDSPPVKVNTAEVKRVIEGLSSDDIEVREKSQEKLKSMGTAIEADLVKARTAADTEAKRRIDQLLEVIQWNRDPPIAYVTPEVIPRSIALVHQNGHLLRVLKERGKWNEPVSPCAWSSGAERLLCSRYEHEEGMWTIGADRSSFTRLASLTFDGMRSFGWSPDGNRISFSMYGPESGSLERVYIFDCSTQIMLSLRDGKTNDFDACWAPDSTSLAFVSTKPEKEVRTDIWKYDLQSRRYTQLTRDGMLKQHLDWSPDGRLIAFMWMNESDGTTIALLDTKSGTVRRVTGSDETNDSYLAWSPDGSWIVFEREGPGWTNLYVIKADGTGEFRVTTGMHKDRFPCWSPDSKHICFQSNRDGEKTQIYVVDVDGKNLRKITNEPKGAARPVWAPFR